MDVASAFSRVFRLAVDGRLEGVCKGVVRIWLGERFCVDAIVAIAQYSPELGGCAPSLRLASSSRRSVPPLSRGCPPKTFQPGDLPWAPNGRAQVTHTVPTIDPPLCGLVGARPVT